MFYEAKNREMKKFYFTWQQCKRAISQALSVKIISWVSSIYRLPYLDWFHCIIVVTLGNWTKVFMKSHLNIYFHYAEKIMRILVIIFQSCYKMLFLGNGHWTRLLSKEFVFKIENIKHNYVAKYGKNVFF